MFFFNIIQGKIMLFQSCLWLLLLCITEEDFLRCLCFCLHSMGDSVVCLPTIFKNHNLCSLSHYRTSATRFDRYSLKSCILPWWSCCCPWSTWLYSLCALKTQWKSDALTPGSACSRTSVSAESTLNRIPWPMVDTLLLTFCHSSAWTTIYLSC